MPPNLATAQGMLENPRGGGWVLSSVDGCRMQKHTALWKPAYNCLESVALVTGLRGGHIPQR